MRNAQSWILTWIADPYNPKKDKSGLIKGIIAAVSAIVVIACYFYLVAGN